MRKSKANPESYPVCDSYLEMIRQFPLRPIRSAAESDAACLILEKWFGRPNMDAGEEDYVQALALLVADYEQKRRPYQPEEATVADRLRFTMTEAGLTQTQLAAIAGIDRSLMSMILSGKRGLSKASIRHLAAHFHLQPGYFL
jgi:HTH-type transcriptional regulator / antitoxin HigA